MVPQVVRGRLAALRARVTLSFVLDVARPASPCVAPRFAGPLGADLQRHRAIVGGAGDLARLSLAGDGPGLGFSRASAV